VRRALLVVVLLGCTQAGPKTQPTEVDAAPEAPPEDARKPELAPLTQFGWMHELKDEDGKTYAHVSVPDGTREPRPIMVALHGAADQPDWACGEWRGVTNAYPFIVCPRGVGGKLLYWSSPKETRAEIEHAVQATKKVFGEYVKDAPIVLVGFSMGSNMAAAIARAEPKTFPLLVLTEGAYDTSPTPAFAAEYAKGGERVLFVCTTRGACEPSYRAAAARLAKRGVSARVNLTGTNQHGMWTTVIESIRRDWPWFVEGADGWETYAPP